MGPPAPRPALTFSQRTKHGGSPGVRSPGGRTCRLAERLRAAGTPPGTEPSASSLPSSPRPPCPPAPRACAPTPARGRKVRPGAREPHLRLPARAPWRSGQLSPESRRLRLTKQKGGGGRYGGGVVWRPPPSVTHSPETPMGGGRERCKRRREEPALLRTPCGVRP